ncbi:recombination-associated protein RdgC [Kangiella sp. HZ709]|uniref:recombination-associated protein RdgC n=1 Tax=Kangiella sp. HZ709 TaxID=2666328 RepID=UPI0012B005CD|nr:recombination-associated protein RdgC [Kangiella sp. HZ709]MRX27267.1 recombination-associated protein RdgC [Kangiella sp. HZ709]
MWFKNCYIYLLSKETELSAESLTEKLESHRFSEVGRQEAERVGWISPLNRNLETLVHSANGCHLVCLRKEQKVIPASMLKERLEDRVQAIENNEGRKVYGKEKSALKDDILSLLKPKALTKSSHTFGYFDFRNQLLVVNAGSNGVADTFVQLLIDSLGTLGAVKLIGEENPSQIMNQWLLDNMPDAWSLTGQYELKDPKDERVAKFKDNEANNSLIHELIEDGYWLQKLGINYQDTFKAVIQSDLLIKSIKYSDELVAENDNIDKSEQYAQFDADFVLMTQTLAGFIAELKRLFKVKVEH